MICIVFYRLFHKLYQSFVLDKEDLNQTVQNFLQAERCQCQWFLMFFDSIAAFYLGLSSYKIYRETRQIAWKQIGNKHKGQMKNWSRRGTKWNFEQKYLLLEAEGYYSDGYVVSSHTIQFFSQDLCRPKLDMTNSRYLGQC